MRELPEPDIISEVKDFACPACHAHLGYQSPIRIGYRRDQVLAIQKQAYEDGLRDSTEKIEQLEQRIAKAESALELIATPKRPDGTWNRDREACRVLAAEALEAMK